MEIDSMSAVPTALSKTTSRRTPGLVLSLGMIAIFCAVSGTVAFSQSTGFTTLVNFNPSSGIYPFSTLIQTSDGLLYGTALEGGDAFQGTIYKISAGGSLSVMHSFNGPDGSGPDAALIRGGDGNFYGTTEAGGTVDQGLYGTVFKMSPAGAVTTLHSFEPNNSPDGYGPQSWLVQGSDGAFYGTTVYGGRYFSGTAFKITAEGVLTILYAFEPQNGSDGQFPYAGLLLGRDGNFYGTTERGGHTEGFGVVFKMTPDGTMTTLHAFDYHDGAFPYGGLVQASDGSLYGVALTGGDNGVGTIFKITSEGVFTTVHTFNHTDGANPSGTLVQGRDGFFYGTTQSGGASRNCTGGCGTIFKVSPAGALTTLHSLSGLDGETPYAGLMQASDGSFYGTTVDGGTYGYGTIFRMIAPKACTGCRQ
jgi:uncharacterized repeat protein (TIGR03803 family)